MLFVSICFHPLGSVAVITNQHLRAIDPDSDDLSIKYIMKKDPTCGLLHLHKRDSLIQISTQGPAISFTQAEINKGGVLPVLIDEILVFISKLNCIIQQATASSQVFGFILWHKHDMICFKRVLILVLL